MVPGVGPSSRKWTLFTCFSAIVVAGLLSGRTAEGAGEGENTKEFHVLCHVAGVAESLASLNVDQEVARLADWDKSSNLEGKLTSLLNVLNETHKQDPVLTLSDGRSIRVHTDSLRASVERVLKEGRTSIESMRSQVEAAKKAAKEALGRIPALAKQAFGAGDQARMKEAGTAYLSSWGSSNPPNRNAACKGPDGNKHKPGFSLPHDIMCLCHQIQTKVKLCGIASTTAWDGTSQLSSLSSDWDKYAEACTLINNRRSIKPVEINRTLRDFYSILGTGAGFLSSNNPQEHWILGGKLGDGSCGGGTDANGICVNYAGTPCQNTGCQRGTLRWYDALDQAAGELWAAEKQGERATEIFRQAEKLLQRTETALVIANATELNGFFTASESPRQSQGRTSMGSDKTDIASPKLVSEGAGKPTRPMWLSTAIIMI